MKNSSDMIEAYTLNPFSEEPESASRRGNHDFITDFDRPPEEQRREEAPEEVIDIEAIARKAFEDAFAQGEKAGYEMGLKRVDPLVKRLGNYIGHLEQLKEELFDRVQAMSVELALMFCEAIILRQCDENREIIGDMARKALEICEERTNVIVRVRREDAKYVSTDGHGFITVVPDDTMREPGFVIETNFGDIDGRISTQIEELKKRILE